jgi:serine/threonine protein kinase/tetratricopeptide (TPR) repeat protein
MTTNPGRTKQIFMEAIQLPIEERIPFVQRACANDEELRRNIKALLRSNERVGDFLEQPACSTLGAERSSVAVGEKPGDRVDRYKLLEQIGEGGWGVVFIAEQLAPVSRRVALKVVKPGTDTKSVIARFEGERQALALMDHPNIAHVFDAGATRSGRPYFVMELVEGVKITEYCDRHSLPLGARLELFVQICDAIQHAHQKGIVHRDIKPSNIIVTSGPAGKPMPKAIDFGIAKAITGQQLTDKTVFTGRDVLIGTPAYMSPEQATMASAEVDTRTDIYSLGVLLYELLTGVTPFDAQELLKAGLYEARRVICEEEPVRPSIRLSRMESADLAEICRRCHSEPSALIRQLRGDLDWIVIKALEKDRSRRYPTASGLAMDVNRYLACETVLARPPGKLYRFRKTVRRNKLLFSSIGIIAMLLVMSLIVVSAVLAKERKLRREAETATIKSQEITKFLEDALQGVGPSAALGQNTAMLRGILDRTEEQIGKEMSNEPAVAAELQNVIGTVYRQIGNYSQAEEMHRAALNTRRALFGSNDSRVAQSLNDLGLALQAQAKLPEAERAASEAFAIRQRIFGEQNADTATSMNDLGAIYRDEGKLAEAETLARHALTIRQQMFGRTNLNVADSLRNLSMILANKGQLAESEATAREVLTIRSNLLGPEHPWIASALADLAWITGKEGKLGESETLQSQALAMRRKLLPVEDPDLAMSLQSVGDTMRKQGNYAEAYSMLSAALSMQRKLLGDDDPASLGTLYVLGLTLADEGKWPEAETVYRNELVLWRKRTGNESQQTLTAMGDLGLALENECKWPEAETLYREGLGLSRKIAAPDDASCLYFMHRLALALEGEGKWPEAESVHRKALTLWRRQRGDNDPQTLYAMRNLAGTYEKEGKWADAESIDRAALGLWRNRAGNQNGDISFTRYALLRALEAEHKWSEAESLIHEEIALQQEREGDTGSDTLNGMHELGLILEGEGKWPEAETVHRDVLALWRRKAGDNDPHTLYAVRDLAEMFEHKGILSEAEALYRQEFESWRKLMGNEDQQTLYTRRKLGLILEAEGKWPQAESVFRESLALSRNKGNEDPEAVVDLERLILALMPQKKIDQAGQLLDDVLTPEFVKNPSSVSLLNQRVNVLGRQGRWREAATDSELLMQLQPTEPYNYHRLAALFAISQDQTNYEQLCQKMITTFTNTANPYVDERIANDCLLLPHSGVDLGLIDKFANLAVTLGSNETAVAYFQGCRALCDYRLENYPRAIEWAQKATDSPTANAQAKAKAFAVLAMANWQLGQKDAARTALIRGNKLAPALSHKPDTEDLGDSWVAWLMARVSLDEATALVRSPMAGTATQPR